jgi:predicted DNA-binding transcriptional regulator AlpA
MTGNTNHKRFNMRKWFEGAEQVRKLRQEGKSLTEICQATGVSKATAYGWIKDMPVPKIDGIDIRTRARRSEFWSQETIARRAIAIQKVWGDKRDQAYNRGIEEAAVLLQEREVRDFVCLYLAEGTKRGRGIVCVVNTDPSIVVLCDKMLRRFSSRPVVCRLFCSEDEKEKLLEFWAGVLGMDKKEMRFQKKKKVSDRRAEYGLASVLSSDTYFKCRLMAWIDTLKEEWSSSLSPVNLPS